MFKQQFLISVMNSEFLKHKKHLLKKNSQLQIGLLHYEVKKTFLKMEKLQIDNFKT